MLGPRPTLTFYTAAPVTRGTQRRLRLLIQARCGPCVVVLRPADDPWATATTYSLSGPWQLSRADVHQRLVSVFDSLVSP
ncbi:hypothetical protein L1280_000543 [Deinococcus sp. HSC-46F16]|uniref:hypothetical protein n=1 Tax=Deinococcus sp. HSC-46F16 TaxID=2910968 RepID=UPI00209DE58E|nr:hypothetical protein [Deinococcus sp. HSC-46F16]MCP2013415.1 hypothetical protein [Deinococcus sp. HSC-46F16]